MESRSIEYLYGETLTLTYNIQIIVINKREKKGEITINDSMNLEDFLGDSNIVKINGNNEIYLNFSKIYPDFFIFPKPLDVKKILAPEKIENESVKLLELSNVSYTVAGIKIPNTIPFVILETSEGTKIVSKDDIFVTVKKEVEHETTKEKRKRKARKKKKGKSKKSTRKQKSKSKSVRKGRRISPK